MGELCQSPVPEREAEMYQRTRRLKNRGRRNTTPPKKKFFINPVHYDPAFVTWTLPFFLLLLVLLLFVGVSPPPRARGDGYHRSLALFLSALLFSLLDLN